MTFLFLTLGYHPDMEGGACRFAAALTSGLIRRGHRVEVITTDPGTGLPLEEELGGVEVHRVRVGEGMGRLARRNREAGRLLEERMVAVGTGGERPVLVVDHAYYLGALGGHRPRVLYHGPWALEHRYRCQGQDRGWVRRMLDGWVSGWFHRRERRHLAGARDVWVASEHVRGMLTRWHPGLALEPGVIGGGVDTEWFREPVDREACRQRWGLGEGVFLWLAVRRLDPRMGLDRMLEAFGRLGREAERARLWLAGRGEQREVLERRVRELGLADRVRFLGYVEEGDLPGLYGAADCVLMPSLDLEGFGLATVEALACGTPVLASDTGANREVLEGLDPGLLFGWNDGVEGFRERMASILSGHRSLPGRAACAAYARERYGWERVVERVLERVRERGKGAGS